jgi:hypothetical protein
MAEESNTPLVGWNGTPIWMRNPVAMLWSMGPAVLVLAFLLGQSAGWVPSILDQHITETRDYQSKMIGIQWAQCINAATTKEGELRCNRFYPFLQEPR